MAILDSAVNHISISEREINSFLFSKEKLTDIDYNIKFMTLYEQKEFNDTSYTFRKYLKHKLKEWTYENSINWRFTINQSFDKLILKRTF